jgi:FtsH-binding integral membrane protein
MQGYQQYPSPGLSPSGQPALHAGVAKFMSGIYMWMMAGVGVTAAVAYAVAASPQALGMFFSPTGLTGLGWVAMLSPLGMLLLMRGRVMTMSPGGATAFFLIFAATEGLMFSMVPAFYPAAAIGKALLATVGMFAGMAAFGYITKKDLSGIGQFLMMALFGIIIASVINMVFVQSSAAHMGIDILILLVFAGLTAYDSQKLKQFYLMHGNRGNIAVIGALELYLDFINIFLSLLHLFSGRE